jgi:acyl-CoA reductase-like NAD-dependent aldehyde dehydrogenase
MVAHPVPRKIALTGSIQTGKRVATSAAADLKRVTLELGGNDAAILLPDIDLEASVADLFWGAFANCGQVCVAIKRLYAPRGRYAEVVEALAATASAVHMGDGMDPTTDLGPLNNKPHFLRFSQLVSEATAKGALPIVGGQPLPRPGYFFAPTIFANASEGMRIVDDEQFGPALPVIAYDTVSDAIARANDTSYGLGGSVWGQDLELAKHVAAQLQCATTWINAHRILQAHQPFSAVKSSGIGVHCGQVALADYTDLQTTYERKPRQM